MNANLILRVTTIIACVLALYGIYRFLMKGEVETDSYSSNLLFSSLSSFLSIKNPELPYFGAIVVVFSALVYVFFYQTYPRFFYGILFVMVVLFLAYVLKLYRRGYLR